MLKAKMMLALGATLFVVTQAGAQLGAPVVKVAQGSLQGTTQGETQAYLGIPYAAPPLGERRWKPPVPAASWRGVRDATKFGANCFQNPPREFGPYTAEYLVDNGGSEDCLFLNVWTPTQHSARLPVLVWIYGGGFASGSGSIPIYNGSDLAAEGAVVVTINYRLGILGMLAHPELSAESADKISGNYNMQDIIAALRWVKTNIAQFGGESNNVTIAGQSAGAVAVNNLIMAPSAKGLFQRAITQSGSSIGALTGATPLSAAEVAGKATLDASGISSIAAARAMPVEKIWSIKAIPPQGQAVGGPMGFRPVIDGKIITANPEAWAKVQSSVPQMTGFNLDEGGVSLTAQVTSQAFEESIRQRYGALAEKILALYPHSTDSEATASSITLARDATTTATLYWSRVRAAASGQPVYNYRFEQRLPGPDSEKYGAFHTAEVPYVFGTLVGAGRVYMDADRAVSALTQKYWLNFMRTGNPNGAALPIWDVTGEGVMAIDANPKMKPAASTPERLHAFKAYYQSIGAKLD